MNVVYVVFTLSVFNVYFWIFFCFCILQYLVVNVYIYVRLFEWAGEIFTCVYKFVRV